MTLLDLRDKGIAKACEEFGIKMLTETRGIVSASDVTNAVEGFAILITFVFMFTG